MAKEWKIAPEIGKAAVKPPSADEPDTVALPRTDDPSAREANASRWTFDGSLRGGAGGKFALEKVGQVGFSQGKKGKSLTCDGQAYVRAQSGPEGFWNEDFTIACWIFFDDVSSGGIVLRKGEYGNPIQGWTIDVSANRQVGMVRVELLTQGSTAHAQVTTERESVTSGRWHHLCVTARKTAGGRRVQIYVDGMEKASGLIDGARIDNPKKELEIGRFHGRLDELVISDSASDADAVLSLAP